GGGDRERADCLTGEGERGDAAASRRVTEPDDRSRARGLGEADDGRVVAGLQVAVRVPNLDGQRLGRAGGDARRVAREGEVGSGADGDGEDGGVAPEAGHRGGE